MLAYKTLTVAPVRIATVAARAIELLWLVFIFIFGIGAADLIPVRVAVAVHFHFPFSSYVVG